MVSNSKGKIENIDSKYEEKDTIQSMVGPFALLVDKQGYDCILFAEIIWYIFPDLDSHFEVMRRDFKGTYLMVLQVFYKGTQKYGTEYFTSLSEFSHYVPFKLVASCEATLESDSTIETSTLFRIE